MIEPMREAEDGEGMSFEEATMESFGAMARGFNNLVARMNEMEARLAELEENK